MTEPEKERLEIKKEEYRKSLLKAAEIAEKCKAPDYDWNDWDCYDATYEMRKIIAEAIRKEAEAGDE